MTGGATDPPDWQPLIRNKTRREALAKRFRNVDDPLRMVLVRDMWLTGFDAPSLHTMYVDKPMRGHGLMQAIARVNRVFKRQAGRPCCRLPGLGPRTQARIGDLHRERRHRENRARSRGSSGGDVGEVRNLLRPVPRLRPVQVDHRHILRNAWACCRPRRSTSWRRKMERIAMRAIGTRVVPSLRARRAS